MIFFVDYAHQGKLKRVFRTEGSKVSITARQNREVGKHPPPIDALYLINMFPEPEYHSTKWGYNPLAISGMQVLTYQRSETRRYEKLKH